MGEFQMNKSQTIEALIRLSQDKTTTEEEREAARTAIKTLTDNQADLTKINKLILPSSSKAIQPAKFQMPPWIQGHDDRAYRRIERLEGRLIAGKRGDWHGALMRYVIPTFRPDPQRMFKRDGFVFRLYGGLGFQDIWVVINDTEDKPPIFDRQSENHIQIYDGHRTGWRDGPWWNKLDTVIDRWIVEADALDAEYAREAARKKQAEIDKENDIFTQYMRNIK
jgi:hypothetical protein